ADNHFSMASEFDRALADVDRSAKASDADNQGQEPIHNASASNVRGNGIASREKSRIQSESEVDLLKREAQGATTLPQRALLNHRMGAKIAK
ncbi:MAG: hypothetical protein ABI866_02845, partial [Dokdonella sp.]